MLLGQLCAGILFYSLRKIQDTYSVASLVCTWQYEAALAVDSVRLIAKALSQMVARDSRIFSSTLRHGKFFNNGTEGIDCDSEPVVPWRHGYDIMKTMREVGYTDKIFTQILLAWRLKGILSLQGFTGFKLDFLTFKIRHFVYIST